MCFSELVLEEMEVKSEGGHTMELLASSWAALHRVCPPSVVTEDRAAPLTGTLLRASSSMGD